MLARLHVRQRCTDVAKVEGAIDDRPKVMQGDRPVHGLEHLPAAGEDSLQAHVLHQQGQGVELRGARQHADQTDLPLEPNGSGRFPQRSRSADFNDMISTNPGREIANPCAPLGLALVIDAIRGAESLDAFELLIAARGSDDPRAKQAGKLQRE